MSYPKYTRIVGLAVLTQVLDASVYDHRYPKNSATLQKKLRLFCHKGKLCGCWVFYPSINLPSKGVLIQALQIFIFRPWNSLWRIKSNFCTKTVLLKSRFRRSVIKNLLSFSDFRQRHVWPTEWL